MKTSESPLQVGDIVKYKQGPGCLQRPTGYMRIRSIRGKFCNLCAIFGRTMYAKSVPLEWLMEAGDEWSKAWQQTESYQCM